MHTVDIGERAHPGMEAGMAAEPFPHRRLRLEKSEWSDHVA